MSWTRSTTAKRALAAGGLLLALVALVVAGLGASGDDGGTYRVRAIFDSASFLVPGEDVKASGVVIGAIESLDVTRDHKAAIVLRIDDPAFQDFRRDATCAIRLQSLIGEKYIQCATTQPRGTGEPQSPPLRTISAGPNEGQKLLPVEQTSAPVDVDLITNVNREPERQRLALIINELGVGLAGNGDRLRAVLRRANPAIAQLEQVLKLLSEQDQLLYALARDSDAALGPVAREADRVSRFVDRAGKTAEATAERGDALEASFARLPRFLRELRPTMERLEQLADAGEPIFANLRAAAPSINQLVSQVAPFSDASLPALRGFGEAADVASRALPRSEPLIKDLKAFGKASAPLARDLSAGLTSLRDQHGFERLMDTILYFTGAINGFDSLGHYLRTYLMLNAQCIEYKYAPKPILYTCNAQFDPDGVASASAASAGGEQAFTPVAQPQAEGAEPAATDPAAADDDARSGLLDYLLGSGEAR